MKIGYVYIITNKRNGTLYIGVTNDIQRRIFEHKNKIFEGFSKKYALDKLVYLESFNDIKEAIAVEKMLKGKTRDIKLHLIESRNPNWDDLSLDPRLNKFISGMLRALRMTGECSVTTKIR